MDDLTSETGFGVFVSYHKNGPDKIVYWSVSYKEAQSYMSRLARVPHKNYFVFVTGTPRGHVDDPLYGEPQWSGRATS